MAIFSQLDEQTTIDYRNYNQESPNRNVPFKFEDEITYKIMNFINTSFPKLNLTWEQPRLITNGIIDIQLVKAFDIQKHNTCLNRKISIDKEGYIKNCPSMKQHYGNIRDTTLQQALAHPDFKKYWNVNKDQINVCKDCEFRYICTDCRAYVEDPQDMYSKPLKCGYNPYTCEWEEWSTNPLKQQAIDHYNLRSIL